MGKHQNIFLALAFLLGILHPVDAGAQALCPLDTLKPQEISSFDVFRRIPVLEQGRIKPMETYARNFLLQLSGKRGYGKEQAVAWFARFLFAPRATFNDKVFLINNPEILEAIGIEPGKTRRYAFKQLEDGYPKLRELAQAADAIEPKERSAVEREILRVYSNLYLYSRLSGATAFAFPHPDFTIQSPEVRALLQLPEGQEQFSFYDILERWDLLRQQTVPLIHKEQSQWSKTDQRLIELVNALFFWFDHYADCPLGLIPTQSPADEQWFSPMDIIRADFQNPVYHDEITYLRQMTIHYWNGKQIEFDLAAKSFIASTAKRLAPNEKMAVQKIPLELLYNQMNLFAWAKTFYGAGFFFLLCLLLGERKNLYRLSCGAVILGIIPHALALVLRIIIMARPPVSNLYETFIFVGLAAAAAGLILEGINKNGLGLTVSAIGGFVFLFMAGKFGSDGDTMQMLVAVLNSNFWLSTHVLAITAGYAGCSVAGILGHIYIIQAMAKPKETLRLEQTYKNLIAILGFGLTMTFLGTALGGIWADQSWGRFWGWDPKENGALLIVLWCAILFHARIAKLIHPLGVTAGCILGLIVVMWAWFGVNLLSVGLHSYGFISGVATGLGLYVLAEFLFLVVSLVLLGKKGLKV